MFKGWQVQLLNQGGTRNICAAPSIYDHTAHLIVDEAASVKNILPLLFQVIFFNLGI